MRNVTTKRNERARDGRRVLLLGGSAARRAAVGLAVRLGGHTVFAATTPLEAIARLQDGESGIGVVVVAGHLGDVTGDDLISFLGDEFPEVRVVAAHRRCRTGGVSAWRLDRSEEAAWKVSK